MEGVGCLPPPRFPSQPTDPASPVVVEAVGPVMTNKQNI